MNRFVILAAPVLVVMLMAPVAQAGFTPISPAPSGEMNLLGSGGILDTLYGLGNLQRISDSFIGDQLWGITSGGATAMEVAKFAGLEHAFGVIPGSSGGTFMPLFSESANLDPSDPSYSPGPPVDLPALAGPFRLAINQIEPLWSSRQSDNSDGGLDHMVTWKILGTGSFVVAWEDLSDLGDHDYNDLVVQVNGVAPIPEPGTLLLLGSGFVGMGTMVRRRRKRNRR